MLSTYAGRPTPLTRAGRFEEKLGKNVRIYLKREDLNHTGAHKLNNAIGQALLAKAMGKTRIVAETGAGQHGVAAATVAAHLGMECVVYMGTVDYHRQSLNVFRMELLGAQVRRVDAGSRTLKDAINEAMRDWVANVNNTHYLLGSVLGPHPYPVMVRDFQSIIGVEARKQVLDIDGKLPDLLVACVGGGSNSIGLFYPFLDDESVAMTGVEAGGTSLDPGQHAARFAGGRPGVLHGTRTYLLQDENGQVESTHSISAGLDYPAIGPEHARLHQSGRVEYTSIDDALALEAFGFLSRTEGIIPALESSHAVAEVIRRADTLEGKSVIINISGRGDKDVMQVSDMTKGKVS